MNLRNGVMSKVVLMIFAVGLALSGAHAAQEPGKIKVIKASGNVTAERKSDHKTAALKVGDTLEQGCVIQTGKDSSAVLLFANGSAITLSPSTTFSIDKFQQDPFDAAAVDYKDLNAEPSKSTTRVTVSNGEIVGNMRKLNKGSSWDFNTPLGVAGIRGTIVKFTVTKVGNKVTVHFTAAEGTFQITPGGTNNKVVDASGQPITGPLTVARDQEVTLTVGDDGVLVWTLAPLTGQERTAILDAAQSSVDVGPTNPFTSSNTQSTDQNAFDNAVGLATGDQGVGTLGTQIGGSGGGGGNGGSTPTPTPTPAPAVSPAPGSLPLGNFQIPSRAGEAYTRGALTSSPRFKSLPPGLIAGLLCICALWAFAAQLAVWPFGKSPKLKGPDGLLTPLEDWTINLRFKGRGELPAPLKVVYVNVDPDSIDKYGSFPWNRGRFGAAIDALFDYGGVKAVGMDFVFSDQGMPDLGREEAIQGNLALGKSIYRHKKVVAGATFRPERKKGITDKKVEFPFLYKGGEPKDFDLPEFSNLRGVGNIGYFDVLGEGRMIPYFARTEDFTYYPLSLQLALLYWGLDTDAITITATEMLIRRPDGSLVTKIPLQQGQLLEQNWFAPWHSEQSPQVGIALVIGAAQVLETGTDEEKKAAEKFFADFKDAIVLIGPTDPLLGDTSPTPIDPDIAVPRVSVHGNALKTLVSGRYLHRPPVWVNILLIFAVGLLASSLSIRHRRWSVQKKILSAVFVLAYVPVAFVLFDWFDLIIPIVAPIGAGFSCSFLAVLWQLGVEEAQRRRMTKLFGSYLSPQVVNQMVELGVNPEVGGAEVEITALFSDIEAFSRLSETLTPSDLVELMCEYLTECTAAIVEEKGTLDKYVGDAIIAIYGAPMPCDNHAAAACRAALGIQAAQEALGKRWAAEGSRWPQRAHQMRTRIGLNTGLAVVGNLGSELRFNYTMMGDNVNLAQRIEAAAAHFGVNILVSGTTYAEAAEYTADFAFRHIDRILVAGRTQPVEVYELVGLRASITEQTAACLKAYDEGLKCYFTGDWAGAIAGFRISAEEETRLRAINPSAVMLKRCEGFLQTPPPAGWDFASQLRKA